MLNLPSVALWACLSLARSPPARMSDDVRHRAWMALTRVHDLYGSNDLIADALVEALQRHAAV